MLELFRYVLASFSADVTESKLQPFEVVWPLAPVPPPSDEEPSTPALKSANVELHGSSSGCADPFVDMEKGPESDGRAQSYSKRLLFPIILTVWLSGGDDVGQSLTKDSPSAEQESLTGAPPALRDLEAMAMHELEAMALNQLEAIGQEDFVGLCNAELEKTGKFMQAQGCQGDAYLLPGVCVFKPELQPHAFESEDAGDNLRNGFKPGTDHLREIAAYAIDSAYGGFAGVPVTVGASVGSCFLASGDPATRVHGSMQEWVPHQCSSEDISSSRFTPNNVHTIGILDVLLYNTDRHAGNLLVAAGPGGCCGAKQQIFPIDHGLCLPDFRYLGQSEFDWLYWKQSQAPFTEPELELVASLNGDHIAGILNDIGLPAGSVLTARLMVELLHETVAERGWTLKQVGVFCTKNFTEDSSALEDVVARAIASNEDEAPEEHEEHAAAFALRFRHTLQLSLDGK